MNLRFLLLACAAAIGSFAITLLALGKFPAIDLGLPSFETATFDPAVFNYSRDQVQTMLDNAKTTLPRRDGPGQIEIWGAGRSGKGVTLNMRYASWAPLLSCEAVVTSVATNKSRVIADCGGTSADESAIAHTQDRLRTPMFEEHIQATLNKRLFNRANVDMKERGIVITNLGAMQREALQAAAEESRRKY
jgi:hypothetical protein